MGWVERYSPALHALWSRMLELAADGYRILRGGMKYFHQFLGWPLVGKHCFSVAKLVTLVHGAG